MIPRRALLAAPLALAACTSLAPDYQAPALPVPPTVGAAQPPIAAQAPDPAREATLHVTEAGPLPWSDFVQEPRLREVVALALAHNRDLRVATLAIERARAQYGIERSALFPAVNATGAGARSRTADDLTTAGRPNTTGQYSAQLGFSSYEIDFFGRVRSLNDAALQEFFRVAENRRSVQLSLVAEVMNAWLTLDADARRLQLARETLRTRQQALDLTRRSFELGATSALALAQAQTSADTARVDAAAFASQVARDRNVLALLAGTGVPDALLPASVASVLPGAGKVPALLPPPAPATALLGVAADLPSGVLLHRPDLRAAEHALRGSYASIGAARAAFFPSITLTASVGTASNALSGLFGAGNGTWTFAPQIRLPIFDAGRNQANLRVAEVAQGTALAQYEKAIQTAFREVADTLAERATLDERLDAQRSLVQASQRALDLSDARFRLGADNYLAVLDAQRSLYAAQQAQIALQLAEQVNRVTLYKVLGGQWASDAAPADNS
ncbi:adeC/adeK/oprM family multidrug efflux complex outer membrane factor [Alicycliphilus denitrificans]|uniref:efflux transporter outer membrane subunit n=1 Tax=Alicycliphilus denitrificans TaxID=179636 RepID=UPI00095D7DA2|nr:efflux transporter outer membrane subunit [Alicycliphilus denitrificans]MBN9573877.1 efflux transporter outer membrane subunit [Alicycliphilus denitrificans]OJW81658.1 MAG: transporter [Alicycliphilus sp. 69-12]BCN39069.1 adeC/adeK/oprM family multidrug efflux complex outer membrane factor [Alicycliphilus denitrificans]